MKKLFIVLYVLVMSGLLVGLSYPQDQSSYTLNPEKVGDLDLTEHFSRIRSVCLDRHYAWIFGEQELEDKKRENRVGLVDIGKASEPKLLKVIPVESNYYSNCIYKNFMYCMTILKDENTKLEIFDISDPLEFKHVKTIDIFDGMHGRVGISGNKLLVTASTFSVLNLAKIYMLNLDNPSEPRLLTDVVIDGENEKEYSSLPAIIMGIHSREKYFYLQASDQVITLAIDGDRLILVSLFDSTFNIVRDISVIPEMMERDSLYLVVAGETDDLLKYPWELNPDLRNRDTQSGLIMASQSIYPGQAFATQMGYSSKVRIPIYSVHMIESDNTLVYVFGADKSPDSEKSWEYPWLIYVVDFNQINMPKIVGTYAMTAPVNDVAKQDEYAYVADRKQHLQVIKLPITKNEFEFVASKTPEGPPGYWDPRYTATINPKGIDEFLRIQINKPDGELKPDDFKDLKTLNLAWDQLTDIDGIQMCTNLEELDLGYNQLKDLSPLSGLTKLTTLNLTNNDGINLDSLESLSNLKSLTLDSCDLTDISPLAKMTNLEQLSLSSGKDLDLTPLKSISGLKSLTLRNGEVHDLSLISELKNLENLDLNGNKIRDISLLSGLKKLETLDLSSTFVQDFTAISSLANLKTLRLSNMDISDISFLANNKKLETLYLNDDKISDLSPLSGLVNLEKLILGGNQITDISPLAGLVNLKELSLGMNNIENIQPLGNLINLDKQLDLIENKISDISSLSKLTKLETIYLNQNQVSDITVIGKMTGLKKLFIEDNKVTDISPLVALKNLRFAVLKKNEVVDINPVIQMPSLASIDLSDNRITDLAPLLKYKSDDECIVVFVAGNPLNEDSIAKHIPALKKSKVILGPDSNGNTCARQLMSLVETSNGVKMKTLKGEYGNLDEIKKFNMAPPNLTFENFIPEHNVVVFKTTPPGKKADGTPIESTVKIIAVPKPGKEHSIYGITGDMVVMEWIGDYIPDDFSTVSMDDEKLWRYFPAEFYSGSRDACAGGT